MEKLEFCSQVCTTMEQSDRLLKLGLKKDTADLVYYYSYGSEVWMPLVLEVGEKARSIEGLEVPAWSLHRLMELVPRDFREGYFSLSFQDVGYSNAAHEWIYYKDGNVYECMIDCIEWLIKNGGINQDYLEGEQ